MFFKLPPPPLTEEKFSAHKNQVVRLIYDARRYFIVTKQQKTFQGLVRIYVKEINGKKYRVFGVKKADQNKINFEQLRKEISHELGFPESKPFTEIIGDSSTFSKEGSERCRKYLTKYLEKDTESIILYGFTGNKSKDDSLIDTNQAVNEWVDHSPERSSRVIANIVDKNTVTAIEMWGCSIPQSVTNLFLVYTDEDYPSVKFSEDILLSDGLTNLKVICFDGGVQSLRQLIYMVNRNIAVEGLQGLRDLSLEKNIDPLTQLPYLSAMQFLLFLQKKTMSKPNMSQEEARTCIAEYRKLHTDYNKTVRDADTKNVLLIAAIHQLMNNKVWEKLNLINGNVDEKHTPTLRSKL